MIAILHCTLPGHARPMIILVSFDISLNPESEIKPPDHKVKSRAQFIESAMFGLWLDSFKNSPSLRDWISDLSVKMFKQ